MNKKIIIIGCIALIVVVLLIIFFSLQSPSPLENKGIAPTNTSTTTAGAQQNAAVKVIKELSKPVETLPSDNKGTQLNIYNLTITAKEFTPPELVVKKGTIVQLNVSNKTNSSIDVLSQNLGLQISPLAAGTTINISIDASKEGNFELVCDTLCPAGIKLLGKLVIQ